MADHSRDGRRYRGGACLGSRLGDRAAGHLGARGGIKGFFCAMYLALRPESILPGEYQTQCRGRFARALFLRATRERSFGLDYSLTRTRPTIRVEALPGMRRQRLSFDVRRSTSRFAAPSNSVSIKVSRFPPAAFITAAWFICARSAAWRHSRASCFATPSAL
jgi:hypothetical protein